MGNELAADNRASEVKLHPLPTRVGNGHNAPPLPLEMTALTDDLLLGGMYPVLDDRRPRLPWGESGGSPPRHYL